MTAILYLKKFRNKKIFYSITIKKMATGELFLQIDQKCKETNQKKCVELSFFNKSIQRFGLHIQSALAYLEKYHNTAKKTAQYQACKKKMHLRAYEKWSSEEENLLSKYYRSKVPLGIIEKKLNRNKGGIVARLKKMNLI